MTIVQMPQRQIGVTQEGFVFRELVSSTGIRLYVLTREDVSEATAFDHRTSMRLLDEAGLSPLVYWVATPLLSTDIQLQNQFTNNGRDYTWFYLAGKGLGSSQGVTESNALYTLGPNRVFSKGAGSSIEETILAWTGNEPLSLVVGSDHDARYRGARLVLGAYGMPVKFARMVVGTQAHAGHDPATQKIEDIKAMARQAELEVLGLVSASGSILSQPTVNLGRLRHTQALIEEVLRLE